MLAKDVVSPKGIIILKKGTELTDKFINNIKKISDESPSAAGNYIFIEGNDGESEKGNNKEMEEEIASLEKRFKKVERYEYMGEIKETIKDQIIKFYGGNAAF